MPLVPLQAHMQVSLIMVLQLPLLRSPQSHMLHFHHWWQSGCRIYFTLSESFFGQMRPRGLNTTHVNSMCKHTSEQLHIIHYNSRSLSPRAHFYNFFISVPFLFMSFLPTTISSCFYFWWLCTTLQIIDPANFSRFLLLGDFNVNFCNTHHFLFSHLQDIMLSFSLTQVVPSYTYISLAGTPSLLDLAMLSNPEQLQQYSTIPPLSTSDHYGISLTLNLKTMAAKPCKSRHLENGKYGPNSKIQQ